MKNDLEKDNLNSIIAKPAYALWEQQKCRSACSSAQSDKQLRFTATFSCFI